MFKIIVAVVIGQALGNLLFLIFVSIYINL